jgi:hypothetical protein
MKIILITSLSIFLIAFSSQNAMMIRNIDLFSKPGAELQFLSEFASDVEYVPLQTTENSLISFVHGFTRSNNRFYINNLYQILCFDAEGKYLNSLDKNGRGPEEYLYINDFDINTDNQLIILDRMKILEYNVTGTGFTYTRVLNIRDRILNVDFGPDRKSILLSYGSTIGNEPNRYQIIDLNGNILKEIPNYYKYNKHTKMTFMSKSENIVYQNDKILKFKYWLSDTVFSINTNYKIEPYLILNSHGKTYTREALADFSGETFNKYLNLNLIFETSRYLFYKYALETLIYCRILDKTKGTTTGKIIYPKTETKWVKDDITGGVDFEPKFCSEGILYTWVDALALKKHIESNAFMKAVVKDPDKKENLKKLASSLKATDNPILIIVTPKK